MNVLKKQIRSIEIKSIIVDVSPNLVILMGLD